MPRTHAQTPASFSARLVLAAACVPLMASALAMTGCSNPGTMSGNPDPAEVRAQEAADRKKALDFWREGIAFEEEDRPDRAIISYRKSIETYPDIPMAWNNLGVLLMAQGGEDHLAAAQAFNKAAELAPSDPLPLYNLGTLWEKVGRPDEAMKYYDEAIGRDENHLPSLRRSVLIDSLRGEGDEQTLERIHRALMIETDPWWNERLRREEIRVKQQIETARARQY